MQEKILELLSKKQEYISGDQIASRLGISRQALWKHIQDLKEAGYEIEAVPHLGYKLISSPNRLFPFEVSRNLQTEFVARKIYYSETLASTMPVAMELGSKGAVEGTLVLAEAQTKGKGRLGRIWSSPKYSGIYLSLILRPKVSLNQAPVFTLLAAVSICEALKSFADVQALIKWPNDIILANKKLGGILTELNAETDEVNFLAIGIGLNVNNEKKDLISGAISLKEYKKENFSRVALLQELLRKIEENYLAFQKKGPKPVIQKWRQYSLTLGKRVKVYSHKEHLEGMALDIDTDGGLLVRKDSGVSQKVMAGDVIHLR